MRLRLFALPLIVGLSACGTTPLSSALASTPAKPSTQIVQTTHRANRVAQSAPSAAVGVSSSITTPSASASSVAPVTTTTAAPVSAVAAVVSKPSDPPTSVVVTSSQNPVAPSSPVTYTATVYHILTSTTGVIEIFDGTTQLTSCTLPSSPAVPSTDGTISASCTETYSATGSHQVMAIFTGDSVYAQSASLNLIETVAQPIPTTTTTVPYIPCVRGGDQLAQLWTGPSTAVLFNSCTDNTPNVTYFYVPTGNPWGVPENWYYAPGTLHTGGQVGS